MASIICISHLQTLIEQVPLHLLLLITINGLSLQTEVLRRLCHIEQRMLLEILGQRRWLLFQPDAGLSCHDSLLVISFAIDRLARLLYL